MSRDARYVLGKKNRNHVQLMNRLPVSISYHWPIGSIVGWSVKLWGISEHAFILFTFWHTQDFDPFAPHISGWNPLSHGGYPNLRPCYRNSYQKLVYRCVYIYTYMSNLENPRFTERTSANLGRSHRLPHVCTIMIYGKLGGYRLQETATFIYIYI